LAGDYDFVQLKEVKVTSSPRGTEKPGRFKMKHIFNKNQISVIAPFSKGKVKDFG